MLRRTFLSSLVAMCSLGFRKPKSNMHVYEFVEENDDLTYLFGAENEQAAMQKYRTFTKQIGVPNTLFSVEQIPDDKVLSIFDEETGETKTKVAMLWAKEAMEYESGLVAMSY